MFTAVTVSNLVNIYIQNTPHFLGFNCRICYNSEFNTYLSWFNMVGHNFLKYCPKVAVNPALLEQPLSVEVCKKNMRLALYPRWAPYTQAEHHIPRLSTIILGWAAAWRGVLNFFVKPVDSAFSFTAVLQNMVSVAGLMVVPDCRHSVRESFFADIFFSRNFADFCHFIHLLKYCICNLLLLFICCQCKHLLKL